MLLKKKKYFFFPKLQKKYLLFLFFFIAACCKKGIQIFLEDIRRIEIEFLKLYIYDVGDMLTIIPFIIMKNRSKSERENQDITINKTGSNLEYIYIMTLKITKKFVVHIGKLLFLLLLIL